MREKSATKARPILLADDIGVDSNYRKRSSAVSAWAQWIASRLRTSIDLIHVEELFFHSVDRSYYGGLVDRFLREQRHRVERLKESFRVPVRARFLVGSPAKTLVELSRKRNAFELLVLGTRGRTGLNRVLLGSVAEEVVRNSKAPVMVVGPQAQARRRLPASGSRSTILLATDLGSNSEKAEKYALSLASKTGARIELVHAAFEGLHPVLKNASAASTPVARSLFEEMYLDLAARLERKLMRFQKVGIEGGCHLDTRHVAGAQAILDRARSTGANLIVMGTHGRNLVAGAFFGNTAREVILGAGIPVVVVPSR